MTLLGTLAVWLLRAFLFYASLTFVFPLVSVWQERSIWKPKGVPSLSLWGHLKVYFFNVIWMLSCLVGSTLVLLHHAVTFGRSDTEYEAHAIMEHQSARLCMACVVGTVEIHGQEHLPSPSLDDSPTGKTATVPAPVYIANHSSQCDIGAVYYLNRRFKWIAKSSVKYLPGVGQIMVLGGHVLIDRQSGKNRSSVSNLYAKSNNAVQSGISMFFYPQGTRRMVERLPFKDGAFNVALHNKSTILPISINVPANVWNDAYPLSRLWGGKVPTLTITVHAPIPITGTEDKETLKQQCITTIYSILPSYGDNANKDDDDNKEKKKTK